MYCAVTLAGGCPGMKPPCFFRLSAVSVGLNDGREEGEEHDHRHVQRHESGRPCRAGCPIRRRRVLAEVWKVTKARRRRSSMDEAKIGGMTPEVFSFSGRNEVCPEHAVCRPGASIGDRTRRRCARSMNTMTTATTTTTAR